MRVTTQMLNESTIRAGRFTGGVSLLNYMNSDSSGSGLLSALNKSSGTADIKKYEKLEKTADQLSEAASAFASTGEDSIFDRARAAGDNQEIYDAVNDFAAKYNSTLSGLNDLPGGLNDFYRQMLKSSVSENQEALAGIGITIAKDGSVNVNQEKLKEADIDTLESVLGNTAGFTQKTAFVADHVSDNAHANQSSLSGQYSSGGTLYSSWTTSKYNFLG